MRADPPGEAPWAMPIVVRVEKGDEPTAAAVAEAGAMAVVRLLDDARTRDGEWAVDVARWLDGRIRKVARRARGEKWRAAAELPGITVEHSGAHVRAFVPTPTDAVPPEISKLQVAGLELESGTPTAMRSDWLPVALTPLTPMSALKSAVQVAHAAQLTLASMPAEAQDEWRTAGFGVCLFRPDADQWANLVTSARVVVHDAGFTEIAPGTLTAIALWTP